MNVENPRNRNLIAWVAMLSIGLLWGSTIPMSKTAVSTGHQPFGLIFWQFVIGVIVLGIILFARGWRPKLNKELIFFYALIAVMGTIIPNGFSYLAAAQLPGGVLSIVIATVPMFALVIALGLRLESFSVKRLLGILIGFAAMVMIALPQTSLPEPEKAIFVLVALIAPVFYALESNYIAVRTPAGTDAVSTLFMASCVGVIITAPLSLISGQWINPLLPWHLPEYALIATSVIHAITYVGYIWLVGFGGAVFGVQVAYPVTISGVLFSILLLGEGYSIWIWGALVLVILGLVLVQPALENKEQAA